MPEYSWAGASSALGTSVGSSPTYYGNFGSSAVASYTLVAQTTENNVQSVHRGPDATLKGLRVVVHTNARLSNSTLTTRKNGADTAQTVTITASTTGTFTDLSDNVSLTAGDTYSYSVSVGGTANSFVITLSLIHI